MVKSSWLIAKLSTLHGNTATVHTYTNKNPAWTWTYWGLRLGNTLEWFIDLRSLMKAKPKAQAKG